MKAYESIQAEINGHAEGQAIAAWRAGNNGGDGFAFDATAEMEFVASVDNLDIYSDEDGFVLVGDSHGPWAVRVTK